MSPIIKYPRSFHLPWSESATHDDKVCKNVDHFIGKEVVVTEKLDGEGFSMYQAHCHARSLDSGDHPSRHWVKMFHSSFGYRIPEGYRFCGENMFAKHSIHYTELASYFYLFSIWNEENVCLSWDDTVAMAADFGIETVSVLYRGVFNEALIKQTFTGQSVLGGEQEGYVIRLADAFHYDEFSQSLAKFVRKNHVQTDQHWLNQQIVPNQLKK